MNDIVEPRGPPRPRRQDAVIEAFGENAPSTQNGAASEAARDNDEPNRPPCQRQVTQTPKVSAVDTLRTRPASGTRVRLAYVPDSDHCRRTITDSARYLKAMRDEGRWSKGLLHDVDASVKPTRADAHTSSKLSQSPFTPITPLTGSLFHAETHRSGEAVHPRACGEHSTAL